MIPQHNLLLIIEKFNAPPEKKDEETKEEYCHLLEEEADMIPK